MSFCRSVGLVADFALYWHISNYNKIISSRIILATKFLQGDEATAKYGVNSIDKRLRLNDFMQDNGQSIYYKR